MNRRLIRVAVDRDIALSMIMLLVTRLLQFEKRLMCRGSRTIRAIQHNAKTRFQVRTLQNHKIMNKQFEVDFPAAFRGLGLLQS